MSTECSFDIYRRAQDCIAQGALTNSKRPESYVLGVYPTHAKKASGGRILASDGKMYIDLICGLGTNLIGYSNHLIAGAVQKRLYDGITMSLSSEIEVQFAEKVKEIMPWVSHIKVLKSGTEACMAATKIARAYTGIDTVGSEGYHGWSDDFVSMHPPALGVPDRGWMKSSLSQEINIFEPVITDWSGQRRKQIENLGGVKIYDEVITGLRVPQHTWARYWNHTPDLVCLGKALGGGMPLSVVAGKKEIMECGEYFVSSTFGGETASLAAGIKMIELMQTKYNIENLWQWGQNFMDDFNSIWPDGIKMKGYPTRGVWEGSELTKALFMQECALAGVLVGPSWFFCFPHMEFRETLLLTFQQILSKIKMGSVPLKGEMPKKPFAQGVRK